MIEKFINLVPWKCRDFIRQIPLVAHCQRWVFKKFFSGVQKDHRIDAGPAKGLVFPIRLPEDKLFWTGTWELDFAERLAAEINPGAVCFDVGSYRGYFGGLMAVRGSSEVHCFEPNAENCQKIRRMADLNPDRVIKVHEMAMGAEEGELEFLIMPDGTMGKLATSKFQKDEAVKTSVRVRVGTVDAMIARGQLPHPTLLKVDIEGAEEMFLEGSETCLKVDRPMVLLEYHSGDLARSCAAFLSDLGYRIELIEASSLESLDERSVGHFIAKAK